MKQWRRLSLISFQVLVKPGLTWVGMFHLQTRNFIGGGCERMSTIKSNMLGPACLAEKFKPRLIWDLWNVWFDNLVWGHLPKGHSEEAGYGGPSDRKTTENISLTILNNRRVALWHRFFKILLTVDLTFSKQCQNGIIMLVTLQLTNMEVEFTPCLYRTVVFRTRDHLPST